MTPAKTALALLGTVALCACGDTARHSVEAGTGPAPVLPNPVKSLITTVKVAEAAGWPQGRTPIPAAGLRVNEFAGGLEHPRWLYTLPNGDILVAESASPGTDKPPSGLKGFFQKMFMKKAGGAEPSANRVMLLRDANGDGVAEQRSPLLTGLYSPFGMALVDGELLVANANALVAFPFKPGQTQITAPPRTITALPSGYNHHWTKSLVASPDGARVYVGVGSNSNVGENGMAMEKGRAAVWEIDPKSGAYRIFAGGLRNPVGIAFNPASSQLWVVVNERDELGSDLVPDYITSVREGAFYGWPYSYYGQHVDTRIKPPRPDLVAKAIKPDFALGSHVAPLGLTFSAGQKLGPVFAQGAFIGEHGSWNRNPPSGYKVVFVPFAGAQPSGMPIDILTGFMIDGKAFGRPVGVQIAGDGSLLIADDVGGKVWRVSAAAAPS